MMLSHAPYISRRLAGLGLAETPAILRVMMFLGALASRKWVCCLFRRAHGAPALRDTAGGDGCSRAGVSRAWHSNFVGSNRRPAACMHMLFTGQMAAALLLEQGVHAPAACAGECLKHTSAAGTVVLILGEGPP